MFTGIIQKVGRVLEKSGDLDQGMRLLVATGMADLELGESIAVNGACLTVAEAARCSHQVGQEGISAFFALSPETLRLTNLAQLAPGSPVNLERALQLSSRLSGHLVQGHVDGIGRLLEIRAQRDFQELEIELPAELARYCVPKGSIAVDGVSLTLNRVDENRIGLTIIPHTWSHTRFSTLAPGDSLNIEVDPLAKIMEKLCQPYLKR